MIENCGLSEADQLTIIKVIQSFEEIEEVILYGSRAKGNYKKGSDVDLAIQGKEVTDNICSRLHWFLNEETTLPYFFDVTCLNGLNHEGLLEHIKRVGKSLFLKKY